MKTIWDKVKEALKPNEAEGHNFALQKEKTK